MRQHLVLVLQLHAKHRVRQRLNHGRHYFDGIFFSFSGLGLMRSCISLKPTLASNPAAYQTGPAASFGRVRIHGPFFVTATVCSKCAESLPSAVTAVHSSSNTRTPGPPVFTIGSMASTMPSCSLGP